MRATEVMYKDFKIVGMEKEKFVKPTLQEVQYFIRMQNITNVDAEVFCNYYESNGWKVGRNAMKNWQMAVKGWATRNAKTGLRRSHALKGNKNNYNLDYERS